MIYLKYSLVGLCLVWSFIMSIMCFGGLICTLDELVRNRKINEDTSRAIIVFVTFGIASMWFSFLCMRWFIY